MCVCERLIWHIQTHISKICQFLVPSENKKDQRSIEQTLADIRAKKRKLETNKETSSCSDNSTK